MAESLPIDTEPVPSRAARRTRTRPSLQNDPLDRTRTTNLERTAAAILAFLFFFGPCLAFVAGKRPVAFENHALAPFPSARAGWGVFTGFDAWAGDHLVGRQRAVQLNRALETRLFGEQPPAAASDVSQTGLPGTAQGATGELAQLRTIPTYAVLPGKNGVLYFWADVREACAGGDPQTSGVIPDVAQLRSAVLASGRRFYFTVAPDKSTVESRFLPDHYLGKDCSTRAKARFWDFLANHAPPGYVPVLPGLQHLERVGGTQTYRSKDSHWNGLGSVSYAEALVEAISPGSTAGTYLLRDPNYLFPADLSMLQGGPNQQRGITVLPERAGVTTRTIQDTTVTVTPRGQAAGRFDVRIWHSQSTSTSAPLVQPRVVVLGDSFTGYSIAQMAPYFHDITWIHIDSLDLAPQLALPAIAQADVVVVERAERDRSFRLAPGLAREISTLPPAGD